MQITANLINLWGAASVSAPKNGSTGIGKKIDSIAEIKPKALSAIGWFALTLAFLIYPISKRKKSTREKEIRN